MSPKPLPERPPLLLSAYWLHASPAELNKRLFSTKLGRHHETTAAATMHKHVMLSVILIGLMMMTVSSALAGGKPDLLLAKIYADTADVRDYWISEKFDGVRAYWDGETLVSRQGNAYHAPAWFTRDFPQTPLDGELWLGRGRFEELVSTVRKQRPVDSQWRDVRYLVFELPNGTGSFSDRLKKLHALLDESPSPFIRLVEQFRLDSHDALMQKLREVTVAGGEGLMLHRADARYHSGRSSDLLKLKPYLDTEATVLAQLPGKGKYKGMMGALLVEDNAHRRFRIGSGFSDQERRSPPPIGSIITYRYHGKTRNGLPRHASFLRIRSAK